MYFFVNLHGKHDFYAYKLINTTDCLQNVLLFKKHRKKKSHIRQIITYLNLKFYIFQVCNSKMQIIDIVPRWSGNSHDAFIWKNSSLRQVCRTMIPANNFLLGDSGYPLEPWLLTPYSNPSSPAEELFNQKHIKCRNVIERCFGLLKSRFRCIDQSGGILCYAPDKVCKIIIACAVLHNICIKYRLAEPTNIQSSDDTEDDDDNDPDSDDEFRVHFQTARAIRDRIAHHFQTQR